MKKLTLMLAVLLTALGSLAETDIPKREFRGAWLHVIGQTQYQQLQKKGSDEVKAYISQQLDKLQDAGCNVVIFQVRPTADALYISDIEPWSTWLTGKRGTAPSPMWDPLEYVIKEAHKRGMELHAWLNPYRVTSDSKEILPPDHLYNKEPERFVRFDGKIFFDPAYPENRDYISDVVRDIVKRYDVDAIHIDDYFYPYPDSKGNRFNKDDVSYAKFGNGKNRNDWRRENVNKLIEQLNRTIKDEKPWVRFGVSPFGIWRNKKNDPRGSESNGLQNYDDLYADVLLWAKNKWIDYMVPQLYWDLDLQVAPTRKLAKWWNDNAEGVDLYLGYDVKRTMNKPDPGNNDTNELATKVKLTRSLPNVGGVVWWPGYEVTGNCKGVAEKLRNTHQATLALPPAYGDAKLKPKAPANVKIKKEGNNYYISWDAPSIGKTEKETDAVKFVVYEFLEGETPDINNAEAIISITPYTKVEIADGDYGLKGLRFAVTALDRMNRESEPVWKNP